MGFENLLGNDRLKQNLTGAFARNRVSHFYLISGPAGSGKKTLSRLVAAAAMCSGENRPCLSCAHCRKVMANTHPDFITIDDPEKRNVPVELIRQARSAHLKRLNEGRCTIELGFVLADVLGNYERVSDHCSNIAVAIIEAESDRYDSHNYLDTIKSGENKEFQKKYKEYSEKYAF